MKWALVFISGIVPYQRLQRGCVWWRKVISKMHYVYVTWVSIHYMYIKYICMYLQFMLSIPAVWDGCWQPPAISANSGGSCGIRTLLFSLLHSHPSRLFVCSLRWVFLLPFISLSARGHPLITNAATTRECLFLSVQPSLAALSLCFGSFMDK